MAKKPSPILKTDAAVTKAARQTASGVQAHVDMAAGTELSRDGLARERHILLVKVTMALAVCLVVSVMLNLYLGSRPIRQNFFTTDPAGNIHQLEALNRPMQGSELVLNWTTQAVTKAYSLNFANYAQQLKDLEQYFNEAGWLGYQEALQRAGFVDNMLANQYVTTAVPRAAPVVLAQGNLNGRWAWRLQVPIVVTYKSASVSNSQDITVEVIVTQRAEAENPSGLGIAQILSQ
jgi:intracellular multiplication protein IcmL